MKLKWYCSVCKHQCKDPVGFRMHIDSEKHRVMMASFRENKDSIIAENSRQFEMSFIQILKNRFPNREVPANTVYVEVIKERNHTHMNSTRWESLNGFCLHLEQTGKINLRMTERGPMIQYATIHIDPPPKEAVKVFIPPVQSKPEEKEEELREEVKVNTSVIRREAHTAVKTASIFG